MQRREIITVSSTDLQNTYSVWAGVEFLNGLTSCERSNHKVLKNLNVLCHFSLQHTSGLVQLQLSVIYRM